MSGARFILTDKTALLPALAAPQFFTGAERSSLPSLLFSVPARRALGAGVDLRIMPLGASITFGLQSTDGNGYRQDLRRSLESGGNPVNMVGSRKGGNMTDGDNEGWPGFVVDEVFGKANESVPKFKPNLVLINAGTNDCIQDLDVTATGARMRAMILGLLSMSPRATVVLSSLIVNKEAATEANVLNVNKQYQLVATSLRASGRRVVFADMHGPDGPVVEDLVDDTHPNDLGYRKMAAIWYRGISEASTAGFLISPEPVDGVPDDGGS